MQIVIVADAGTSPNQVLLANNYFMFGNYLNVLIKRITHCYIKLGFIHAYSMKCPMVVLDWAPLGLHKGAKYVH